MSDSGLSVKRLAILPDFREEGWPSMDLCAEQLLTHGRSQPGWHLEETVPTYRARFGILGQKGHTLDRAWNRFVHYPQFARRLHSQHDFYHIVDHSYAHLVHSLPAERTGVYCHDLDAFRSLLEPEKEPRGRLFRWLMNRVLTGLQRARVVFSTSQQTTEALIRLSLVDPSKIVMAPLGIADEFQPSEAAPMPFTLVHVGSCIPRKRVDVLLQILSNVRDKFPSVKLIKIGGEWSPAHQELISQCRLHQHIEHRHNLTRIELAKVYQQASIVLVTSEQEGFGLPVIEALACGSVVLASDIPPLREAGGQAALYAPVADVSSWTNLVIKLLKNPQLAPDRFARKQQAQRFSWAKHAEIVLNTYHGFK
jgi:glycosyltransferase involved in cell wall biosynthesis